jgi:hypothetical protein
VGFVVEAMCCPRCKARMTTLKQILRHEQECPNREFTVEL